MAILMDEFIFHRQRGLPLWERIGHPIDTFATGICYVWILFRLPTEFNIGVYIGLCVFSSLLITKDEFIHQAHCRAAESWLHAVLFVLHPVSFMAAFLIWLYGGYGNGANAVFMSVLVFQVLLMGLFFIYQILFKSS